MRTPKVRMLRPALKVLNSSTAKHIDTTPRIRGRRGLERRKRWLAEHPLCVKCKAETPQRVTVATEVDHIIPLIEGGADDETNLQSLCTPHHQEKSGEEARGRGGVG